MAQVFVSFIHEEEKVADCVQHFIREVLGHQIDSFLSSDKWAIYAGEQWLDRIMKELKEARVVISMLSPRSVTRPWVNFEAGAAWGKTALIPVCFHGQSKEALPKPYSNLQAVDLTLEGDDYYLITSIAHHLQTIPPPPPLRWASAALDQPNAYRSFRRCLERALADLG